MVNVDVDVDEQSLQRSMQELERRLQKGASKGLDDTLNTGVDAARNVVMTQRRPFTTPHLHNSFETEKNFGFGDTLFGFVINRRDNAAPVDLGVSGTQRQRDTPLSYTNKMPPLEKMIEFVEERMGSWSVDDDDFQYSGSDGGDGDDDGYDSPLPYEASGHITLVNDNGDRYPVYETQPDDESDPYLKLDAVADLIDSRKGSQDDTVAIIDTDGTIRIREDLLADSAAFSDFDYESESIEDIIRALGEAYDGDIDLPNEEANYAKEWRIQDAVTVPDTGEVWRIRREDEDRGGYYFTNSEDEVEFYDYQSAAEIFDHSNLDADGATGIRQQDTYLSLVRNLEAGTDWDNSNLTFSELGGGDVVSYELFRGDEVYALILPEEAQNEDDSSLSVSIFSIKPTETDLQGEVINNADYRYGVEEAGTIQEQDINRVWEDEDLDLESDFDRLLGGGDYPRGYYRELDEYDVPDKYGKLRPEEYDLAEGVDIVVDNGSNTYEAEVTETYEDSDKVTVRLQGFDGGTDIRVGERERFDIIARQLNKEHTELETERQGDGPGDEAIFDPVVFDIGEYDRVYGEVQKRTFNETYDADGNLLDIEIDTYKIDSTYSNRVYEVPADSFVAARKDAPEEWGKGVDYTEPVDSPDAFTQPDTIDDELLNLIGRDSSEVVIEYDGEEYVADVNFGLGKYEFDAGFNYEGDRLDFKFDDAEALVADDRFDLVAVENKIPEFRNLSDNDDVIFDASGYSNHIDRWNFSDDKDEDEPALVRGDFNDYESSIKNTFQTFRDRTNEVKVSISSFVGTRKNLSGAWSAKDLNVGDKVTFTRAGQTYTGRYEPKSIGEEREKSYLLGDISVWYENDSRRRSIDDIDVEKIEKQPDYPDVTELPEDDVGDISLPDKYTEFDYRSYEHDLDSDSDETFLAWSYREGEYITVEKIRGYNQFSPPASDKQFTHEYSSPDEVLNPIRVVGRENS